MLGIRMLGVRPQFPPRCPGAQRSNRKPGSDPFEATRGLAKLDQLVARGFAGKEGIDIFDYTHAHCLARLHRSTAQVRQ